MKKPIGIFDSGVGGLTVYKTIRNHFIEEDLVYFGDTARVPYGPKSPNTIIDYSIQNSGFCYNKVSKSWLSLAIHPQPMP
jgi:glutamate racemase